MNDTNSFDQLKILHLAMIVGVVLFGVMCLVIKLVLEIIFTEVISSDFIYLALLILIALVAGSDFLFKNRISMIGREMPAEEKLANYRSASLIRFMLVEVATIVVGVGYLLTGDISYLLLMVLAIGYFIYIKPAQGKFIEDLDLSYSDQQKLEMG